MGIKIIYYIIIFLLQVILFNHLEFSSFIMPQVFIILLISMPVYWNKAAQIGAGFGIGLAMDFFVATPGLHASACLWLVLIRMGLLSYVDLKNMLLDKSLFTYLTAGNALFFRIMISLTIFYHIYIFFIENMGSINWISLGLTILTSSLLSILVISLLQLIFYKKSNAST